MFEKWKTRYEKDWATEGQLQRLVVLDVLTEDLLYVTSKRHIGVFFMPCSGGAILIPEVQYVK